MRKLFLLSLILIAALFINSPAQQSGAFVASMGIGITSAQGDFSDPLFLNAGSGSGIGGQLAFYPINGFGLGGFIHYMRFGSAYDSPLGRLSYNFTQLGGIAKLNLVPISGGTLYLTGGGGIFTPNAHYYIPDASFDMTGDRGFFGFGGLGISSDTHSKVMYELEMRYNLSDADFVLEEQDAISVNRFDFIYVGVKLSLSSKGRPTPPRF